ncbi:MAG: hypothetical protein ACLPH3_12345, partial [Terracidiphilus sp.]
MSNILKSYFYWTYPRGNVHYDVMVSLILIFIFVTPHLWDFGDKPSRAAGPWMSSGKSDSPSRRHSSSSWAEASGSRAKWTARRSLGWSVRAYWRARAVAMSSRSTRTITACRLSTG